MFLSLFMRKNLMKNAKKNKTFNAMKNPKI